VDAINLHHKNYTDVKSKINTNLPGKLGGLPQKKFGQEVKEMMQQNEYKDTEESQQNSRFESQFTANAKHGLVHDHKYKKMDMYQIDQLHRENKQFVKKTRQKDHTRMEKKDRQETTRNMKDERSDFQLPSVARDTVDASMARIGLKNKDLSGRQGRDARLVKMPKNDSKSKLADRELID